MGGAEQSSFHADSLHRGGVGRDVDSYLLS
jgi:hypothetical protein